MGRIEGHVGAAGFEDAEGGDDHRSRAIQAHGNAASPACSEAKQVVSQLIGTSLKLPVGKHGVRRGNR
jgi:hypothetical protein